jgi:hypothetical protein
VQIDLMIVVLPAPFGPSSPTTSFLCTLNETSSTATIAQLFELALDLAQLLLDLAFVVLKIALVLFEHSQILFAAREAPRLPKRPEERTAPNAYAEGKIKIEVEPSTTHGDHLISSLYRYLRSMY